MSLSEKVQEIISKLYPSFNIKTINDEDITINGSRLSISDLNRILDHVKEEEHECVLKLYISQILNDDNFICQTSSWDDVVGHIMPRIHHESLFEKSDSRQVVHSDWVNDCVIVYVYDSPRTCVSLTMDQLKRWNVSLDDVEYIARGNIEEQTDFYTDFKVRTVKDEEGHLLIFNKNDGYASSRILCDTLWGIASPIMGREFLAAIPTRDTFCLCSLDNKRLRNRFLKRTCDDYATLPYRITNEMFLVTRDGIAPWRPWV